MSYPTILYIEDNPGNRLLVRRVLEASGYAVFVAPDGATGLEAAAELRPDLILLDINLPETPGYELAGRLRGMAQLARIPVVAVTSNVMKGDREKALAAGCDGYIPKPIDIEKLPAQIERALREGGGRRDHHYAA